MQRNDLFLSGVVSQACFSLLMSHKGVHALLRSIHLNVYLSVSCYEDVPGFFWYFLSLTGININWRSEDGVDVVSWKTFLNIKISKLKTLAACEAGNTLKGNNFNIG